MSWRRLRILLALMCLLQVAPLAAQVSPSQADIDRNTHTISSAMMSPFCPGRTLNDCPSSAAGELKQKIAQKVAAGESNEAILEGLYQSYGDQYRAVPKKSGFGLLAWLTPAIFLFSGLAILIAWLFLHKAGKTHEVAPQSLDEKTLARIKEEISKN